MTSEEAGVVRKYGSSPLVAGARVLGFFGGLGAIMLGGESYLGFPFDPSIFPAVIGITAFVGLVGGMTALSVRRRAARALRLGVVQEAQGTPEWGGSAGPGRTLLRVGSANLAVPQKFAAQYRPASTLQLGWVSAGRRRHAPGVGSVEPVLLVSANGAALARPLVSYLRL